MFHRLSYRFDFQANGKNDTALLKNKLENMQAQVVVDPETAIKKLKEIEEEKAFKDAERVKAYDVRLINHLKHLGSWKCTPKS